MLINFFMKKYKSCIKNKKLSLQDISKTNNTTNTLILKQHYTWNRYPGVYIPKKTFINNSLYPVVQYESENKNNVIFLILVIFCFIKKFTSI